MVLQGQPCGRVGRCRVNYPKKPIGNPSRLFAFCLPRSRVAGCRALPIRIARAGMGPALRGPRSRVARSGFPFALAFLSRSRAGPVRHAAGPLRHAGARSCLVVARRDRAGRGGRNSGKGCRSLAGRALECARLACRLRAKAELRRDVSARPGSPEGAPECAGALSPFAATATSPFTLRLEVARVFRLIVNSTRAPERPLAITRDASQRALRLPLPRNSHPQPARARAPRSTSRGGPPHPGSHRW
jgi:hypothetical protein